MKMPFGKHRGTEIGEIPHDYLAWLLDNCDLSPTLERAIANVLFPPEQSVVIPPGFDLNRWYRQLSLEFHPDRPNGTHEGMKAVNRGYELAKAMAGNGRTL